MRLTLPLIMFILVWFCGVLHHIQNTHMLVACPSAFRGNVGILSSLLLLSIHILLALIGKIHLHSSIATFGALCCLGE